jgi:hypothetical protein
VDVSQWPRLADLAALPHSIIRLEDSAVTTLRVKAPCDGLSRLSSDTVTTIELAEPCHDILGLGHRFRLLRAIRVTDRSGSSVTPAMVDPLKNLMLVVSDESRLDWLKPELAERVILFSWSPPNELTHNLEHLRRLTTPTRLQTAVLSPTCLRRAARLEWLRIWVVMDDQMNAQLFRELRQIVATSLPALRTLEFEGFGPLRAARTRAGALGLLDRILADIEAGRVPFDAAK